jgi:signal peptidase I
MVLLKYIMVLSFTAAVSFAFAQTSSQTTDSSDCFKEEERIVRGSSMVPLVNPGDTIKILVGYYDCHPVERGDIVAYRYYGNKNPVIKMVKGIPGDEFHIEKNDGEALIHINGEPVKNSENIPYRLNAKACKMLSLYEQDYNGTIPESTYLLLGNQADNSVDSRRFGLIDKRDIIGKVRLK